MTDGSWFLDETQITLPKHELDGHRDDLEEAFLVTVVEEDNVVRIIGSPVVIAEVRKWLVGRGIILN